MKNHELFSRKLRRYLSNFKSETEPAKDGYHTSIVWTQNKICEITKLRLNEVSELTEEKPELYNDSGCRILNYKYTFKIPE